MTARISSIIIGCLVILALAIPFITLAQTSQPGFVPLAPGVEDSAKLNDLYASNSLADYITKLFYFALTIGAILAVIRLMYGGYLYMGSADMWGTKSRAKEIFGDVVFGVLLLLAIWIILNQINPNILRISLLDTLQGKGMQQVPQMQATNPVPFVGTPGSVAQTVNGVTLCTAGSQNGGAPMLVPCGGGN